VLLLTTSVPQMCPFLKPPQRPSSLITACLGHLLFPKYKIVTQLAGLAASAAIAARRSGEYSTRSTARGRVSIRGGGDGLYIIRTDDKIARGAVQSVALSSSATGWTLRKKFWCTAMP
jgi:hypothetical protein